MHDKRRSRRPDLVFTTAEQQAGYFTARQARAAGLTWERLTAYAKAGAFRRVAQGLYRLTRFPSSPFEDLFVAWLRCGPESAVSHESALAVYGLSDVIPSSVHITIKRTASRRRRGIRLHTNRLSRADVTRREGLRVTTVSRTVGDVARAGLSEDHVESAIQEALERGLTTKKALRAEGGRRGGRAARLICACLGERGR